MFRLVAISTLTVSQPNQLLNLVYDALEAGVADVLMPPLKVGVNLQTVAELHGLNCVCFLRTNTKETKIKRLPPH